MTGRIPVPNAAMVDAQGRILPTWYRYFTHTENNANLADGNYGAFTALDGTATLAIVNGNVGTFGSATKSARVTVNNKGLVTAASEVTITADTSSISGAQPLTSVDDTNVTMVLAGSPSQALLAPTSITLGWTGTLAATRGGTGFASYAVGDLVYADTTTTLAQLADIATGNALISGGVSTAPSWGKIGLTTHVSGTLPVANGGTNVTALGDITKVDDTNVTMTLGGTPTGAVITSTSFTLGWTGNLAVVRGGTGSGTAAGAATNLGLGTGDSPQFTAVNIGHASDTTLARSGAGDLTIEGNAVYRAGGTDVALADGGTGATLADPNADRVMFWDDSAAQVTWLTMGTNLTITGTTLDATGGGAAGTSGNYETLDVDYTDGGNVTTTETDLFTKTLDAGELGTDGDRIEAQWAGTFVSSATATRQLRAYFGGTLFFDTGALTLSTSSTWEVECTVIRISSSAVRCSASMTTEGAALAAYTDYTEITGLTLANTQIIKLTGTAAGVGAASDDIIGKAGYVEKHPLTPGVAPDGDYGDITISSSGTVLTIDNDVVTYAKMQNISATDRLLGRDTAGAGDTEELTVGGGVEFTGSGGIQRSALTGDVTATAGSNTTTIANDAVTYAKMQNVSATDKLLGRDTAGAGDVEEISLGPGLAMASATLSSGVWQLAGTGYTAAGVYDQAVDGNDATIDFAGLGSFNELLVVARGLTNGTSGTRQLLVSVDSGATFYSTSGDYQFITNLGVLTNTSVMATHGTASTAARSIWAHIVNTKGVFKFCHTYTGTAFPAIHQIMFVASASDINAIRVTNSGGGDMTAGTVHVYAR